MSRVVDGGQNPSSDKATFVAAAIVIGALILAGLAVLPRVTLSSGAAGGRELATQFDLPVIYNGEAGSKLALSDLKGSPVLIDFWATWCGPCAMQTPILQRLAKRYAAKGLKVVGINVVDDNPQAAAAYAARKQIAYPILLDETGLTQRSYGVNSLPALLLVDKEGRVVRRTSGVVDEASLDRMLQEIL